MTYVAVIMLLIDHVKYGIFCIHEYTTMMKIRESFDEKNDERQTEKQGTYIYFDTNSSVWICSRKVNGRYLLV